MLNPKTTALVLIDLQKGYCEPGSDCSSAPLNWDVSAADDVCRAHIDFLKAVRGVLPAQNIIWTQMEETRDTYAKNSPHIADDFFVDLCVRGTRAHEFHVVKPNILEPVVFKTHPSAFSVYAHMVKPDDVYGGGLDAYLKERMITDVAFTGVIESRCVAATINGASERGYKCWALRDMMAYPTRHSKSPRAVLFDTEARAARQISDGFLSYGSTSRDFVRRLKGFAPS